MKNNIDACPVQLLIAFAIVLYCLANAMAAEKNEPAKVRVADNRKKSNKTPANGAGPYTDTVPQFTIKDPHGKELASESLFSKTGMLIMLTVPNLTQYERQKRWEKWISKQPWPEANGPKRVLLEDLSQQETFKQRVRTMMAEKYNPNGDVIVLVDEDGSVRRQFNVQQNETVLLLVDSHGRVIHHEADYVEPDQDSAKRLVQQVRDLADTHFKPAPATTTAASTKVIMADILPMQKN
ncbi:MAG TPA: hypothetical protein VEK08_08770 [Planctomycetota bacterium]|nr:hypothetical protein [Planctomycetota bacterium]